MGDKSLEGNPFAALFKSQAQAAEFSASIKTQFVETPCTIETAEDEKAGDITQQKDEDEKAADITQQEAEEKMSPTSEQEKLELNDFLERVFLITLNPEPGGDKRPLQCVYLAELQKALKDQVFLNLDVLGQAVFERLMLSSPEEFLINTSNSATYPKAECSAAEADIIRYLFGSYCRLNYEIGTSKNVNPSWSTACETIIMDNTRMSFQRPYVFGDIDTARQFLKIYIEEYQSKDGDLMCGFFERVALEIEEQSEDGSLAECFTPILKELHCRVKEVTLGQSSVFSYLDVLTFFTRKLCLTELLLNYIQPLNANKGKAYEETLLGSFLSISCLVKSTQINGPFQFFDRPSRFSKQEHDITESSIQQPVGVLNERMYQLIYCIVKHGGEPKNRLLEWIGRCLAANRGRAKMWASHMPVAFHNMYAEDGFLVNLCAVLLRLSQPFSFPKHPRLLKIQPSYCQVSGSDNSHVHLKDLNKETYLIPLAEGQEPLRTESKYSFVTECFFMTHQALYLGLHVVYEKFLQLNQDLHRIQSQYQEIEAQGGGATPVGQQIRNAMERDMTLFLCMKAALNEPLLLDLCFNYLVATSTYLTHVAVFESNESFQPVTFPLPENVPIALTSIPEFVAENILDFMIHIRRFKDTLYEVEGDRLKHLMTLILVFMGSPDRMRNPHFRARLAEALEALMPPKSSTNVSIFSANFHRKQLFLEHPFISELAATLLHVFVSIEMTGQAVQFEQKFNYRRPMYTILEYIWDVPVHRRSITDLAKYAEDHLEDPEAPLFLRFINLLINDAIFLLDEALSYMTQIKEKQDEQTRGEWDNLAPQQRGENERMLRQLTMLARFHNIMAVDTIKTIQMLTADFSGFFVKDMLVDRIAAMLNYFLLHLVGPKKKTLKVKDFDKYEFKPQELVSTISQIYINLGSRREFCLAVSQDGRSYSHELFVQAQQVLLKIRKPQEIIEQLVSFGRKVKIVSEERAAEEEALADAPEEFLDSIMGTLMKDPVLLPSGHIVDRATIARHLLSDQTDPFSRQPLSMDKVKPHSDLKDRLDLWLQEIRAKVAADKAVEDALTQTDTDNDSENKSEQPETSQDS